MRCLAKPLLRVRVRVQAASRHCCSSADPGVLKPLLQLTQRTYNYLLANTREHPALRACREDTTGRPGARMQITPEQGALMALLVELTQARRVLEIGTYTGYSALALALALPPDGTLLTCDRNAETMAVACTHWAAAGCSHKVEARLGPALETLDTLLPSSAASFDLAFIDADKRGYTEYYERCLQLVRVGGLVCVDNTLWYGRVADDQEQDAQTVALRAFNAAVLCDDRVSHAMVPIGDGLTLLRRRV